MTGKEGKCPGQKFGDILCAPGGRGKPGQGFRHLGLIGDLVEHAPAFSDRVTRRIRRHQQHRQAVGIRLAQRSTGVGHARPRDHQRDTGLPGRPGPPFCHKPCALLVSSLDVTNTLIKSAAEIERVHARNAEYRSYPISL